MLTHPLFFASLVGQPKCYPTNERYRTCRKQKDINLSFFENNARFTCVCAFFVVPLQIKYIRQTMSETKSTITGLAKGIFKDRGSKFLAFAEPIANEEEAKARIAWYKKKYHDARHVCYAYRLGENLWRTKDDGEPHGTAGMPSLRSIDAQKLDNILVVVVRYFGGTLLGTGGLMVAYREATKEALKNAEIKA